ncbi:hypothetical protein SCHPADRAFT_947101 [Schizopora paradoxa]|uniref:Uncharacterized protein n=1 Tax=Schizopora paradoxa TaxID=27342 RepID=A0A0H2R1L7_9AGAM|nr:hypothetical protein SCHPADRAFT_947101 [Schizopora paradoxa]
MHHSLFTKIHASTGEATFTEHIAACGRSECHATKAVVQQINALRSTAKATRRYMNSMEDTLMCIRASKAQHFDFTLVANSNYKLSRTLSIELIQRPLDPHLVSLLLTILPLTPNIIRLAIKGNPISANSALTTTNLKQLLDHLCNHPFPSLQCLVLEVNVDITGDIRGRIDLKTMRMRWIREQFLPMVPYTWASLRNLCIHIPRNNLVSELLHILVVDALQLHRLEVYSGKNLGETLDLVQAVSATLEVLIIFVHSPLEWMALPSCPGLKRLACNPFAAERLLRLPQPKLKYIDLYQLPNPPKNGPEDRNPLSFNTHAAGRFLLYLNNVCKDVTPKLEAVAMEFIESFDSEELLYAGLFTLDRMSEWRVYRKERGASFDVTDRQDVVIHENGVHRWR